MALTVNARDIAMLTTLAEHRLLTLHQLAAIHRKNIRALRRRLRELREQGMIETDTRAFGRRRGRPEGIISLGEPGLQLLKKESAIRADVLFDGVGRQGVLCLEHQLLVNDCRVHLAGIGRVVPTINAQFFSHLSPFADRLPDGRTLVQEQFQAADTGERVQFVPDGVFSLSHSELGKTLLFFLEVDMGSETVASPQGSKKDLRQKVVNYRALWVARRWGRYAETWGCSLKGFRVLVLTSTHSRLASACRMVQDMGAPDYVWLADRRRLLGEGIWASIWSRGGRNDLPADSILGSQKPAPCPSPADVDLAVPAV